jgi:hypothetical protein
LPYLLGGLGADFHASARAVSLVGGAGAPTGLYCDAIRDEQVKVFRTLSPLDPKNLFRGQFKG